MKVIHKDQTEKIKNSNCCLAEEYQMADKNIGGTIIELTGRYPSKGRGVNMQCKMLPYIIKGNGKIIVEGKEVNLNEGDLILIEPGERYYWQGDLKLFISSIPAWSPEQYKEVE